jgi:hypothetical protein
MRTGEAGCCRGSPSVVTHVLPVVDPQALHELEAWESAQVGGDICAGWFSLGRFGRCVVSQLVSEHNDLWWRNRGWIANGHERQLQTKARRHCYDGACAATVLAPAPVAAALAGEGQSDGSPSAESSDVQR